MTTYGKIRPARVLFSASFLAGLALFAVACSTGAQNSGLALVDAQGNHPSSFLSTHPAVAVSDVEQCRTCHGDDLAGGIAKVSCFTAACHHGTIPTWADSSVHGASAKQAPDSSGFAACRICHGTGFSTRLGTPPQNCFDCHGVNAPHPAAPWRATTGPTHTNTNPANAPVCAACHFPGSPNNPAGHPATPAPAGTPTGCFNNTLCHGAVHSVPFLNHTSVTAATFNDPFPAGCASCHAVTGTSPVSSAPLCTSCHTGGSPLTLLNCTSCHDEPPDGPTATAPYPNKTGAHVTHLGLDSAGTPVACDTCHTGLGSGTQAHYDRAKAKVPPGDTAFVTTYNAKSGAASFNASAFTCANVSCHGGQATPDWQTGTLTVNTQCTSCHAYGTSQYNSFHSGRHNLHVNAKGFPCTFCHNTTSLAAGHFTSLSTPAMEGPASATIGGAGTYINAGNYNPTTGSCYPTCHGTKSW